MDNIKRLIGVVKNREGINEDTAGEQKYIDALSRKKGKGKPLSAEAAKKLVRVPGYGRVTPAQAEELKKRGFDEGAYGDDGSDWEPPWERHKDPEPDEDWEYEKWRQDKLDKDIDDTRKSSSGILKGINESLLNEYTPKEIKTHLSSGKPNPNHPWYEKLKAEYDAQKALNAPSKKLSATEIARQLYKLAEPMAADWNFDGGWESVRTGVADLARQHGLPGNSKIFDFVTRKLGATKPRKAPVYKTSRYKSSNPKTPLEKKAKDAMWNTWSAIAPDVMADPWYESDPNNLWQTITDANRMQQYGEVTPEEEREILSLPDKTLARLASDFEC